MKKILISDPVDQKCTTVLLSAQMLVDFRPGISREELKKIIPRYNGLVVRSETQVDEELIDLMAKMEVIGRAGTGVDNIDVNAATRKGIIVMNTPGGNTISAAEHTFALMLSMCRLIPQAAQSMRDGKWERKNFKGIEVLGKTLGVVGLGKIGREVAIRAKSFGMKVIGYDPILSEEIAARLGILLVDIDHIFSEADIITLHVPLNSETTNLINEKNLRKCKKGVRIINCARGGIINEADLVSAIDNGLVASAAIDVYEKEPPDFSSPIFSNSKIITTPHLGASTEEAQEKVAVQIAEQMIELFSNRKIYGAVNLSVESFGDKEILPFVMLGEKIGNMQAQSLRGKLKRISINISGKLLESSVNVIKTAVLKGFLSSKTSDIVNYVNAELISNEMGIIVDESISGENKDYINLLTIRFYTEIEEKIIAGTVFGSSELRIVALDNFRSEFKPEGYLLIYKNHDKPGMLSAVSRVLADKNINIAGLSLGRFEQGSEALTIISTDNLVNKQVLEIISGVEGVNDVYTVKF